MSLEVIVGTSNLMATLVTLSLYSNYGTRLVLLWGGWYEATKLLWGSMVFQEATSEPAVKAKKLTA
jgi:hypothetical protein